MDSNIAKKKYVCIYWENCWNGKLCGLRHDAAWLWTFHRFFVCLFEQWSFCDILWGGLLSVSSGLYQYVMECERISATVFESSRHELKIPCNLVALFAPVSCVSFPKTKFLQFFVHMRIYYVLKFHNRNMNKKKQHYKKRIKSCPKFSTCKS